METIVNLGIVGSLIIFFEYIKRTRSVDKNKAQSTILIVVGALLVISTIACLVSVLVFYPEYVPYILMAIGIDAFFR